LASGRCAAARSRSTRSVTSRATANRARPRPAGRDQRERQFDIELASAPVRRATPAPDRSRAIGEDDRVASGIEYPLGQI